MPTEREILELLSDLQSRLDGDVSLGSKDAGPFSFEPKFAPGIHALIAVVTLDGGKALCSRPQTILVRRP